MNKVFAPNVLYFWEVFRGDNDVGQIDELLQIWPQSLCLHQNLITP